MVRRIEALVAVVALLSHCRASVARGQSAESPRGGYAVTGTVADRAGGPVADAEVSVMVRDTIVRSVRTDGMGHFALEELPTNEPTLRVRRPGFQPRTVSVRITRADHSATAFVTLDPAIAALDAVRIDDVAPDDRSPQLRAFYGRARANHFGHFLDERTLEELHPEHTSDALRGVPGVVVRPSRRIGNEVRIRGCAPLVWVNGVRNPHAELDDVSHGNDVAAIEVYSSAAGVPAEFFDRTASCGTILVWLKDR